VAPETDVGTIAINSAFSTSLNLIDYALRQRSPE
jgi:hypothetical protein